MEVGHGMSEMGTSRKEFGKAIECVCEGKYHTASLKGRLKLGCKGIYVLIWLCWDLYLKQRSLNLILKSIEVGSMVD